MAAVIPPIQKQGAWHAKSDLNPYNSDYEAFENLEDMPLPKESSRYSNGYSSDQQSDSNEDTHGPSYIVEHLATFRVGTTYEVESPKDGLRKLFQMEKTKGIWTQKMSIRLEARWMVIIDEENGEIVERFPMSLISEPTAFTSNDPRELYNNILVFIVKDDKPKGLNSDSEMHIFQCVRISAQEVVSDVKALMLGKGIPKKNVQSQVISEGQQPQSNAQRSGSPSSHTPGVNVREQVSIFNNAKSESRSSLSNRGDSEGTAELRPQDMRSIGASGAQALKSSQHAQYIKREHEINDDSSSTGSDRYERDVAILNHCFDDIERFIAKLQNAATAYKELEKRRKGKKGNKKKDMGEGLLSMRAKPPPQNDFEDIMAKFKLSFNLLAKLRNHIHDPNSPELIHFLFTPLAVIVDAARDFNYGPSLAAKVVVPLLTRDACDLLDNCCTSKENDLWRSLGDAWSVPRDQWKNYEDVYHPVFTDGWAPEYPRFSDDMQTDMSAARRREDYQNSSYEVRGESPHLYGQTHRTFTEPDRAGTPSEHEFVQRSDMSSDSMEQPTGIEAQRDFERQQALFLEDLRAAQLKVVQVMYPRAANNDKELTVIRGEYLEVIDDSRKWWKTRNIRNQVGHVPHTIVAPAGEVFPNHGYESTNYSPSESPIDGYGCRGPVDQSANPPAPAEWVRRERQGKKELVQSGPLYMEQITVCGNHRGYAAAINASYEAECREHQDVPLFKDAFRHSPTPRPYALCEKHSQERRHSLSMNKDIKNRYSSPLQARNSRSLSHDSRQFRISIDELNISTLPRSQPLREQLNRQSRDGEKRLNVRHFASAEHVDREQVRRERKPHDPCLVIPSPPPLPKWTTHRLRKQESVDSSSTTSDTSQTSFTYKNVCSITKARRRSYAESDHDSTETLRNSETGGDESLSLFSDLNAELKNRFLSQQSSLESIDFKEDRFRQRKRTHLLYVTPESKSRDVLIWLKEKGFGKEILSACKGLTGQQMFVLSQEDFDKLGDSIPSGDVRKLMSHLTVQKNLCGFKQSNSDLEFLLRKRRNDVDESISAGIFPSSKSAVYAVGHGKQSLLTLRNRDEPEETRM